MTEETITYNILYKVEDIDKSIRHTQRYLYFANALRLSIVDLHQVMSGPTLSNILWTSVQLTRSWTNLYRIIDATNKAQKKSILGGILGRVTGVGAAGGAAIGPTARQGILQLGAGGALGVGPQMGLWSILTGFAAANPLIVGGMAGALIVGGFIVQDRRQTKRYKDYLEKQREIARSQGLEF